MSGDAQAVAQKLYDALNGHDPRGILEVLHPDFVGFVSPGMPCGVGGEHDGAEAMLRDCWGVVFAAFDVALEVDERLDAGSGCVVFRGRYVGTQRETGRPVDAAFAHIIRIDGGRIVELRQITDTARWGFDADPTEAARRRVGRPVI